MADHYLEKDESKAGEAEFAGALPSQPQYVLDHEAAFTTIEDDIRHEITDGRINDPNLDPELLQEADQALAKGDEKAELRLEDVIADDSIYPEVRAAVSNVDDPSMPVNTFRSWFLGMIATTVFAGVNAYFSPSWPVINLPAVVAQIIALPLGKAMAAIPYPQHWPLAWFFNPGPFNIKEHSLITIMATVSAGVAYTTDIFIAQHAYYNQHNLAVGYMILLTLSTQLIGFSFAGFCRQVLVWPASMIWPSNLQSTALMNALHDKEQLKFKGWTRQNVFYFATFATFCWEFLPQYLFTSLQYFSWPAWIAPNNKGVNMVFGGTGGLGLGFICFDWNQISYIGSPLYTPWHAAVSTFGAFLVSICLVAPILWATNYKNMGYLTFLSSGTYDRFGQSYNTAHIVTEQLELDVEKYNTYSAQYMPSSFIVSYTLGFGAITAALSHAICFYGKDIIRQFRQSLHEEPDIHARLMSRYKEVPHWWYVAIFLASFAMAVPAIKVYHTELPVWMLIVGLCIPAVYMLPLGVVQGVTSINIGLNVISEMISGYALPGRPLAMMIFKTFGYITMAQGLQFVQDLKFGHYMKVPPRHMFYGQLAATVWAAFVQVGVTAFLFGNVSNMCGVDPNKPINPPRYTCSTQHTFYSASVIYGLLSPYRMFGAGAPWAWSNIAFLVGAVLPIPTWLLAKRFPNSWIRLVNWPVAFNATGYIPPAGGVNITSWFLVCFIFQYFLRRHYFTFWSHSNYILSAAFSAGAALAGIFITAVLQIPSAPSLQNNPFNGDNQWWGNTIEGNTLQGGTFAAKTFDKTRGFAPAPDGKWWPNPIQSSSS